MVNSSIKKQSDIEEGCLPLPLDQSNMIHNRQVLKSRRKELRNNATPAETELWRMLQHSSLGGYKFRRQHNVGSYILDFTVLLRGWQLSLMEAHILLKMQLSMIV